MEGKRGAASSTTPPPAKRQRQRQQPHSSSQAAAGFTDDAAADAAADAGALEPSPEEEEEEEQDVENHSDERESEENDGSLLDEGSASPSASSLPSLPPAPPCTPTSTSSSLSNTLGTPLPRYRFDDTVSSSSFLEPSLLSTGSTLYDDFEEGAITPAPSKSAAAAAAAAAETPAAYSTTAAGGASAAAGAASAPHHRHHPRPSATASLPEDFSEWAVGDRYQLIRMLGRGSYGEVAQAKDLYYRPPNVASSTTASTTTPSSRSGLHEFVAIKRIQSPFDQEVDAVRLFREMHILRRLRGHACIIQLIDVVQPPSDDLDDFHDLYLVFEYVDTDLYKLIMSPQYLTTEHIQTFLYQMLTGLKFIHSSSVIHRDLKPANILLNEDCSLKICDFGLARIVPPADTALSSKPAATTATGDSSEPDAKAESNPNTPATPNTTASNSPSFGSSPPKVGLTRQLTKHVVTRWYRAPELILLQPYTAAVDMWSLGCILAELLSMQEGSVPGYQDRSPLFPGGACYPLSSGEGYLNTNHPNSKNDGNNSVTSTGGGGVSNKEANNTRERLDQLSVIFGVIGPPSADDIASMGKANEYLLKTLGKRSTNPQKPLLVQQQPVTPLEQLYPAADPLAMDLLKKMLQFNPQQRCTAVEALEHPFFQNVRKHELEVAADQALVGPDFLETNQAIDLATLKRRTYEEVLWWRDPNPNNSPTNESETNASTGMGNRAQRPSGEPPTSSSQHQPP